VSGTGHDGGVTELVASLSTHAGRGRPRSTSADRAIVSATIEMLLEDGYERITMAGVAQRAGVSTATLYRRYESKVDLVVGCITTLKDEFEQPYDTGSLAGDLRALAEDGCVAFTSDNGRLIKGLIGEVQRNPELADAMRQRMVAHRTGKARRVIDAAVERGEITCPADPDLALEMIIGPFIYRALVTGEPFDDQFAERLTTLALHLLGAPDPHPTPRRRQ
jgi:AcrR family transcriptional regulator